MSFNGLLKDIRNIKTEEIRSYSEDYVEVVVNKQNLESLCFLLEAYFGFPAKAGGDEPSQEAVNLSQSYGGIRKNQTLYFLRHDDGSNGLAFLWPWGNGELTTAKIVRE